MLELSCHCGRVDVEVARRPDHVNACNCTLCRKAVAHWSYYQPSEVTVRGTTSAYCRADKAEPAAEVRFCPGCGATTHFTLTTGAAAWFGNTLVA